MCGDVACWDLFAGIAGFGAMGGVLVVVIGGILYGLFVVARKMVGK